MSFVIKCCLLDFVFVVIFKECVFVILFVIIKIVNFFINFCVVFDCFKLVMLNLLFKKMGLDFQIFVNFRLILNLMFLLKFFERVVVVQLINYVMINDFGELFQLVYKQLYSIEIVLFRVYNDILLVLDNYQLVILLFLDLLVVFDIVDYKILLNRFFICFGIIGVVFFWFLLYFSNRYQFVNIRG